MKYRILVLLSVLMAACAQMLLKQGAKRQYPSLVRQYLNGWVIGGYGILALSLLLNVFCMGRGVQVKEVSIIESFSYLFVPVLAWLVFKEPIGWRKVGAILVIVAGVFCFYI